jgi:hypothetical protein
MTRGKWFAVAGVGSTLVLCAVALAFVLTRTTLGAQAAKLLESDVAVAYGLGGLLVVLLVIAALAVTYGFHSDRQPRRSGSRRPPM